MKRYYQVVCQLKNGDVYTDLVYTETREDARHKARQALKAGGYKGVVIKSTTLYKKAGLIW